MLTAQSDVIFVFNMLFFRDGPNRPVSFDYVSYNNLSQFRSNISVFRFKTNTFYWMSISADIPSYTQVNLSMNDEFSLVKTNTLLNVTDNLCKDELFQIDTPAEYISMVSSFQQMRSIGLDFNWTHYFILLLHFKLLSHFVWREILNRARFITTWATLGKFPRKGLLRQAKDCIISASILEFQQALAGFIK